MESTRKAVFEPYRSPLMKEKILDKALPSALVFIEVVFLVQSVLVFC